MPATAASKVRSGASGGRLRIENGRLIDPAQGLDGAYDLLI